MPELSFRVGDVGAMPYTASPTISARLHIANRPAEERILSISLNAQIQIQPLGRAYTAFEESRLLDLFGERERWGQTMKPLHWTNVVLKVPPFTGETALDVALPASLDFDVAANKYFYGLETGFIACTMMFSGTIFYATPDHAMQITQIPWDREARFQLPVAAWKSAIDAHYPDTSWLRLRSDTFDRLYRYKVARGIPTWDGVIDRLLDTAERTEVSHELNNAIARSTTASSAAANSAPPNSAAASSAATKSAATNNPTASNAVGNSATANSGDRP